MLKRNLNRTQSIYISRGSDLDFEKVTMTELKAVNEALEEFLDTRVERAKTLSPAHVQYYDYIKEYMMRGGKRFRPIAVMIAYKAITGDTPPESFYRAACSVEILHNASLLHDDLIDHDETRRGGPTFHAKYRDWYMNTVSSNPEKAAHFGMTAAILGGDSLMNLGAAAITESNLDPDIAVECHALYQKSFEELVEGVLLEMTMINNPKATAEMYLDMIRMKTAVLLEKALLMGGVLGRATKSQLQALSEFGVKVGQAFQIQDDVLGSFGDEDVTGKAADGDIKEGKKTMLLLEAERLCNSSQKERLSQLLGNVQITDHEVEEVRSIFCDSGALESTGELMKKLLIGGQTALDKANPPFNTTYKQYMLNLSDFLVKRDY
ncbi:polyprenyl synthetase family protein [Candidatus Thorarchaeota archaeon]|nr:MAG: polyprenyl synthetase family protein [Candidatus Thorarchaeota archaeon]